MFTTIMCIGAFSIRTIAITITPLLGIGEKVLLRES